MTRPIRQLNPQQHVDLQRRQAIDRYRVAHDRRAIALQREVLDACSRDQSFGGLADRLERLGKPWKPFVESPIAWTSVHFLFRDHLGITKDPQFTDNVLYLLLEAPR